MSVQSWIYDHAPQRVQDWIDGGNRRENDADWQSFQRDIEAKMEAVANDRTPSIESIRGAFDQAMGRGQEIMDAARSLEREWSPSAELDAVMNLSRETDVPPRYNISEDGPYQWSMMKDGHLKGMFETREVAVQAAINDHRLEEPVLRSAPEAAVVFSTQNEPNELRTRVHDLGAHPPPRFPSL